VLVVESVHCETTLRPPRLSVFAVCGLQWDGTVEVARHFFLERSRMMQILFSVCVEWLA
jgi:hypothetical protein